MLAHDKDGLSSSSSLTLSVGLCADIQPVDDWVPETPKFIWFVGRVDGTDGWTG